MRKYLPFRDAQIVPNGVDTCGFSPTAQKSTAPSILFVAGTMMGRKSGARLIHEFQSKVLPRLPLAELWMVCAEKPSGVGVKALGLRHGGQLAELYRSAWVFCLPSRWESFGVPYIEAMASGTAVLATPNPGALDVLGGGAYGIIAPEDRVGEELCALLLDDDRRRALVEAGLIRSSDFSWERIAAKYEQLYAEAIASRPNPERGRRR